MRLTQASRKKKFEHLLSTLPPPIADLAAEVAAVQSSRTSMTTLATALVHFMLQDFQERYAGASEDTDAVMMDYVSDMKGDIMEIVDWAASVGDAWKSESSFQGMLGKSREWHDQFVADDTIQYPTEDETVADLGKGWRIVKINPHNAKAEGDIMGHCFARYKDDLWEGRRIGFSLRDPRNRPHVTFDVRPIAQREQTAEAQRQARMNVALSLARKEAVRASNEEINEIMAGDPSLDEIEVQNEVRVRWAAEVNAIAERIIEEGRVPEYQVEQIQAKGNSAPPDRYRPWLAQFIDDNNFYCSLSQRRNLVPTDELLGEIEGSERQGDMIEILYSNVPPERRAEAIEIVYSKTEGWIDDIDEFSSLLSVLIDELKESPDNWNARDHLNDLLSEDLGFLKNDDLDYLHKDLLKVMGGERWLAGLLESNDPAMVSAGIHIVDSQRLDKDPNWAMAVSNAAARTTILEPSDHEMWAFKPDAFADPVERLHDIGDSFHGDSWSNDYLYTDTNLGKRMHELYVDSPAEFEKFISRIPVEFLDDWRGFYDTIPSDGGLIDRPPTVHDSYPIREKMNRDIMRMVKERTLKERRNKEIQLRQQPRLFEASRRSLMKLANMLDEVSPSLSDRLESLL